MYAITLTEDKRINFVSISEPIGDEIGVDSMPDGNAHDYKYINGEFVYDPLPVVEEEKSIDERIAMLESLNESLTEQNAMLTECILELSTIIYE